MKYGWIMPFASLSFPLARLALSRVSRTSTWCKPAQCARIFVSSTFAFQQRLKLAEFDKNVFTPEGFLFCTQKQRRKKFPSLWYDDFQFFRFFVFGFIFRTFSCRGARWVCLLSIDQTMTQFDKLFCLFFIKTKSQQLRDFIILLRGEQKVHEMFPQRDCWDSFRKYFNETQPWGAEASATSMNAKVTGSTFIFSRSWNSLIALMSPRIHNLANRSASHFPHLVRFKSFWSVSLYCDQIDRRTTLDSAHSRIKIRFLRVGKIHIRAEQKCAEFTLLMQLWWHSSTGTGSHDSSAYNPFCDSHNPLQMNSRNVAKLKIKSLVRTIFNNCRSFLSLPSIYSIYFSFLYFLFVSARITKTLNRYSSSNCGTPEPWMFLISFSKSSFTSLTERNPFGSAGNLQLTDSLESKAISSKHRSAQGAERSAQQSGGEETAADNMCVLNAKQ